MTQVRPLDTGAMVDLLDLADALEDTPSARGLRRATRALIASEEAFAAATAARDEFLTANADAIRAASATTAARAAARAAARKAAAHA